MDNDCFSSKSKLCKFLSCGCRRTCSCKSAKPTDNSAKQYPYGAGYWSPYPGPWVPSWFNNTDKPGEQRVPGEMELYRGGRFVFPTQSRRTHRNESATIPCSPILRPEHSVVGHPSLKIYRFRLPPHLLPLLDQIKDGCVDHASSLPSGWMTYLYSLTKQDIALRDVPGMYEASKPIIHYIKRTIERMYNVSTVRIDRNQPHVLKYSAEDSAKHTGVELHHDKCDLTANIMLSRSENYTGGGTYFPDCNTTVRLEYGELLIHPGTIVHGGVDITSGKRYLMIMFCHTE